VPSSADAFPLTPFYPVGETSVSRKVRLQLESGKQYVRAKGTDLTVWELTGRCSGAERKTLLDFYELHAVCGCTFSDAEYTPAEDHIVQFQAKPEIQRAGYENFVWKCSLTETTTV